MTTAAKSLTVYTAAVRMLEAERLVACLDAGMAPPYAMDRGYVRSIAQRHATTIAAEIAPYVDVARVRELGIEAMRDALQIVQEAVADEQVADSIRRRAEDAYKAAMARLGLVFRPVLFGALIQHRHVLRHVAGGDGGHAAAVWSWNDVMSAAADGMDVVRLWTEYVRAADTCDAAIMQANAIQPR